MRDRDAAGRKDALILSKWNGGAVRLAAGVLRRHGYRPVLVSALADDLNADACDEHVLVDWETGKSGDLVGALADRGIEPAAVVNMVEALIPWQLELAGRYGLPSPGPGMQVLLSKAAVRRFLTEEGLSELPFVDGTVDSLDPATVDFYPAIAKPARDSGASRFVRRVRTGAELRRYLDDLRAASGAATEVVVEGFIEGIEFSVDGPVLAGEFRGLFEVEKDEHDEERLHDAGVMVSPPQRPAVRDAAVRLTALLSRLATRLELDRCWLHVEGRVRADGSIELIEINTRPGGGVYPPAIRHATGIDPIETGVLMALPDGLAATGAFEPVRPAEPGLLGLMALEAYELGTVRCAISTAELRALPGVLAGYVINDFRVTDLDHENFFGFALVTGADRAALAAAAARVQGAASSTVENR